MIDGGVRQAFENGVGYAVWARGTVVFAVFEVEEDFRCVDGVGEPVWWCGFDVEIRVEMFCGVFEQTG